MSFPHSAPSLPNPLYIKPLRYTFLADSLTPIRLYHAYRGEGTLLLESVEGGEKWARYSFIALHPFAFYRYREGKGELQVLKEQYILETEDPLFLLRRFYEQVHFLATPGLPRFPGGGIGYFGFELLHHYEKVPRKGKGDLIRLLFPQDLIVFDHKTQSITLIHHLLSPTQEFSRVEEEKGEAYLRQMADEILDSRDRVPTLGEFPLQGRQISYRSNTSREEYLEMVETARRYIRAGDIFQVVLSHRLTVETEADPLSVYRLLRILNPSSYLYLLDFGDEVYVGSSPELLLRVEEGRMETRPIAGTRPRGKDPLEDRRLEEELLADEKENAEHVMLVDLGRNDLGRVAEAGSVHVPQFRIIERYSHVMHIVSQVSGRLKRGLTPLDALLSVFPAGTVSGAPKIRALEIIGELEREGRGTYAGAIGYLGWTGNLDTCIAIRTIRFQGKTAEIQAGAGIVYDSVPEREYEESMNKAKALLEAIAMAEEMKRRRDVYPVK
ncbi:anthranilate synthase component I [Thermicanus aegyptius]|uniref:anthranilate synthase component I n=1 Tax=Thermicanus aegyptius TaxID=94009 RepID=UPI0003F5B867|nr:anthranilate synthase component I [Thermicanus aegyptius]